MPKEKTAKKKESRARSYCFTWNNYSTEDEKYLQSLDCKYLLYGREIGKEGTKHLQGLIEFKNAKSFSRVKDLLKNNHVEVTKNYEASVNYCKKDGNIFEKGEKKKQGRRKDLEEIKKKIEEGATTKEIAENHFSQWVVYRRSFQEYRNILSIQKLSDTTTEHEWYYGETGTGKSRKARTENPNAYLKMCNKWWDHYQNEEVVIIEDFDKEHKVLCHHLKIWGDRYPFIAEMKGGARKIRPKKLIVTSNYHPEDIWSEEKDLNPILRRFKIKKF